MDQTISTPKSRLNFALISALVLSLAFGQLTRLSFSGLPEFYLHDALVVILIVVNIRLTLQSLGEPRYTPLRYLIGAVILSSLANWRLAPLNPLGILYADRLIAYLLLIPTLAGIGRKKDIHNLLKLSGTIVLALGIVQYFLFPDLRLLKYLGWDDHLNRLIFPYFDPTFTGSVAALIFLTNLLQKNMVLASLAIPVILLTYSRSVWLALFIAALLVPRKSRRVGIFFVCALLTGIALLPTKFGEGNNLLRTYSITSRLTHDQTILKNTISRWVFGVGMNNLSLFMPSESEYTNRASTPNNSYLYSFSTTGIIGSLALLWFIHDTYRRSKLKPAWIYILVASFFNNILFYPFILLWMILLEAGLTSAKVSTQD